MITHSYSNDKRNRLTAATLPGSQAFTINYTEADERQSIQYPNGVTTSYAYQPAGPIDTITTKNSGGITLESWDYSYNNVHNITQITTTDGNNDYGYDGLNRLTSAIFPPGLGLSNESYEYDQVGNREDPVDPLLYDYDANNRIQSSPGKTYTFDADGNQTATSANETFTYDVINRLRTYTGPSNTAEYDYDPAGRRIRKTINTTATTWFLWDGTQLIAEYDGAGNRQQRYAYLPGDYAPSQTEDANGTYSIQSEHLQTPKLMTDATETVVWTNHMQAFGESVLNEDPDGDLTAVTLNVRFPGQYADQESGLYYHHNLNYRPSLARFLSRKTEVSKTHENVYIYVNQKPIDWMNPKGRYRNRSEIAPSAESSTIECDGRGNLVIVNNDPHECTKGCTEVHEEQHRADWIERYGKDLCRQKPDGYLPTDGTGYDKFLNKSECKAWRKSFQCLLAKEAEDCKCAEDPHLKADLRRHPERISFFCHG